MILGKEYNILVVDDAKDTQILLEFDLSTAGYSVKCCDSGEEAITLLRSEKIDLILLDMYMPGLSGLETLKIIKEQSNLKIIPVIMLSASNDEDEIVAALELGAGDYVTKPYVAKVLLARMRTAIRLKEKTVELEYLAKIDSLTGINNRGNFFDLSTNAINLANRAGQSIVLAMLDIDFFKSINDNFGHDVGDKVLSKFSDKLREIFRDYDIIGRIGGEEFAVCLPNTNNDEAEMACERLRKHVESMTVSVVSDNSEHNVDVKITVSIGFILARNTSLTVDELLKQADQALYYAKGHGRNQVVDAQSIIESEFSTDAVENSNDGINEIIPSVVANEEQSMALIDFYGIDVEVGVGNVLGDEELFKEILIMFYQDHNQDAINLQSAIKTSDIATAKHISHTLKGVSASVGATTLFEVTKALDLAINEQNKEVFESLLAKLIPELSQVMDSISSNIDVS